MKSKKIVIGVALAALIAASGCGEESNRQSPDKKSAAVSSSDDCQERGVFGGFGDGADRHRTRSVGG